MIFKKCLLMTLPLCLMAPITLSSCNIQKYHDVDIHESLARKETLQIEANNYLRKVSIRFDDLYIAISNISNKAYLVFQLTFNSGIPYREKPAEDLDLEWENSYTFKEIGSTVVPNIFCESGRWEAPKKSQQYEPDKVYSFGPSEIMNDFDFPRRGVDSIYTKFLDRDATKQYNGVDYLDFVIEKNPKSYYYFFQYPYSWLKQATEFTNFFYEGLNERVYWGNRNSCEFLYMTNNKDKLTRCLYMYWVTSFVSLDTKKLDINF